MIRIYLNSGLNLLRLGILALILDSLVLLQKL